MRVDGRHHCFDRGFRLHRGDRFRNQLISMVPNNVDTEDLAKRFVGNHLYKPFVVPLNRSFAVSEEWELANLYFESLRLGLSLSESDAPDARCGVSRARNAA